MRQAHARGPTLIARFCHRIRRHKTSIPVDSALRGNLPQHEDRHNLLGANGVHLPRTEKISTHFPS